MNRFVTALVLAASLSPVALADAPSFVLSHEGRLLDGTDQPVTGTHNMTFGLTVNAAPPASGADTFLWQATYTVNFDDQGHYAVMLGVASNVPGTTTPNPPLTADALAPMATGPLYLAISVEQTALSPRLKLAPSPLAISALDANALEGHPAADFAMQADTYTKEEVDALVDTQATQAVTNLQTTIDTELATKADQSTTYTKTEVDAALATKADATATNAALATKADAGATTAALATKANATDMAAALALKADAANVYSKSDVDSKLADKVNSVKAGDSTITVGGSATDPTVAVNTTAIQARVSGTCQAGEAITGVKSDGTVTCSPVAPQRVVRWMMFDTYDQQGGTWYAGNNASLFGGVAPSSWTDGNYRAVHMQNDVDTIRTLLTRKAFVAAPNALITASHWSDLSSTTGRVTVALMRIKNTTANPINWQLCFYFTSYGGWNEYAGLALNGQEIWSNGGSNYANASTCQTLTIPASKTSTVIVNSPSSPPYQTTCYQNCVYYRNNILAFYNNSLSLPSGLEMVDDLDTLQEGPLW